MFKFLKKKEEAVQTANPELLAVVDGTIINMEDVADPVFAQKMMGDGFAIATTGTEFYAPHDATITMLFPSNHAFGLTLSDGLEVLVHIGIDTVNENGKGFTSHVKADQKVKSGEKIISIDMDYLKGRGYDLTTMIIFTNPDSYSSFSCDYGNVVKGGVDVAAVYEK